MTYHCLQELSPAPFVLLISGGSDMIDHGSLEIEKEGFRVFRVGLFETVSFEQRHKRNSGSHQHRHLEELRLRRKEPAVHRLYVRSMPGTFKKQQGGSRNEMRKGKGNRNALKAL